MSLSAVPRPGVVWGSYPERDPAARSALQRVADGVAARLVLARHSATRSQHLFVVAVRAATPALQPEWARDPNALRGRVAMRLNREGFCDAALVEAVALTAVVAADRLGVQVYDTQIAAAWIMLHNGLAEMATGEGKTFASLLAAAPAALAGVPVHVMTANDYLVLRDSAQLRPVYEALGLTVATIVEKTPREERRAAYQCDLTYATAREVAFDYLRDRLELGSSRLDLEHRVDDLGGRRISAKRTMRGLCMALVDEADSILIDEARTPLIISKPKVGPVDARLSRQAITLASALLPDVDYIVNRKLGTAELTDAGSESVQRRSKRMGDPWGNPRRRNELVSLALYAKYILQRDRDYLVRDGQVLMIDAQTGRVADGRRWSRGIHQMIELKEGCRPQPDFETAAQLTYQRFFPRYHRLCGMSGTVTEAAAELRSSYGLQVSPVGLRFASRRTDQGMKVFATSAARWDAVLARVQELLATTRPVLVATGTLADSESLSARFKAAGIEHQVLNARQDANEANIVAQAGEPGRVTIATNMAGRGTDIHLADSVVAAGGLHVLCCHFNGERRIERQLKGRCGRQGDPGSCETFVALDDLVIERRVPTPLRGMLLRVAGARGRVAGAPAKLAAWYARRCEEIANRISRWRLVRQDREWNRRMAFGGPSE